jgi:mycofactocin precursor peptide MftA
MDVEPPLRKVMHMDHETDTDAELVTETLVEEVSIDGMCGVY